MRKLAVAVEESRWGRMEDFRIPRATVEVCQGRGLVWLVFSSREGDLSARVADALLERVLGNWEIEQVQYAMRHGHGDLTDEEALNVTETALRQFEACGGYQYRAAACQRLCEYLEREPEVILDGFLTFRLMDYRYQLQAAVDRAADDLHLEREHREFVDLLRRFLQEQEASQEIHLLADDEGQFRLVDGAGCRVPLLLPGGEEFDELLGQEDLLISALLTLAPRLLVVHRWGHQIKDGLRTIREIFEDRISECAGCELCRQETTKRAET